MVVESDGALVDRAKSMPTKEMYEMPTDRRVIYMRGPGHPTRDLL